MIIPVALFLFSLPFIYSRSEVVSNARNDIHSVRTANREQRLPAGTCDSFVLASDYFSTYTEGIHNSLVYSRVIHTSSFTNGGTDCGVWQLNINIQNHLLRVSTILLSGPVRADDFGTIALANNEHDLEDPETILLPSIENDHLSFQYDIGEDLNEEYDKWSIIVRFVRH